MHNGDVISAHLFFYVSSETVKWILIKFGILRIYTECKVCFGLCWSNTIRTLHEVQFELYQLSSIVTSTLNPLSHKMKTGTEYKIYILLRS
jgi:hypothetical protein